MKRQPKIGQTKSGAPSPEEGSGGAELVDRCREEKENPKYKYLFIYLLLLRVRKDEEKYSPFWAGGIEIRF